MTPVILLLDDDPNVLRSLGRVLTIENYHVLSAGSATHALRIVEQFRVDLAIVDYILPDMSGLEFIRRIRNQFPEIIPVLFTGNPDFIRTIQAIKDGEIKHYISKPWDNDTLKSKLKRILRWHEIDNAVTG